MGDSEVSMESEIADNGYKSRFVVLARDLSFSSIRKKVEIMPYQASTERYQFVKVVHCFVLVCGKDKRICEV
jgi:hypothetical protein